MGNSKKNESLEAAIKKQNEQIEKNIFGNEENDKEYQDALNYILGLIKEEIKNEYLVNGAILSCQMATGKDIEIDGIRFRGGHGSRTRLKVNRKGKISGKAKAIILDCKKEENIFPFGNCLAELPDPVKEKLKNNQQARIEGTCKYLMWLEEKWENVFEGDNGSFCYEGNPELTMNSVLFCKRGGAFIYPLTSGQRITKYDYELIANQLTKEKILLMYKYQLTFDEYKISQDLELDEIQLVIFMEMREYFKNEPSLKVGNVIFTFEGLGSYSGPTNSDHPNGQFGAIFIYCKDGEIVCMSDNCSTLPDHNETATIEDGIYDAVYWNHGKNKYSALQLRNYENVSDVYIPACYHDISNNNIVIKKMQLALICMRRVI